LAELEAADALKKLAAEAAAAGKTLTEFALIQVRSLINRINTQIETINKQFGTTNTPGSVMPSTPMFPTPSGPIGNIDYTVPISNAQAYAPGLTPTPMSYADVRLTIDVAQTGNRFEQLIAESIQAAGRNGYSTSAAGQLP